MGKPRTTVTRSGDAIARSGGVANTGVQYIFQGPVFVADPASGRGFEQSHVADPAAQPIPGRPSPLGRPSPAGARPSRVIRKRRVVRGVRAFCLILTLPVAFFGARSCYAELSASPPYELINNEFPGMIPTESGGPRYDGTYCDHSEYSSWMSWQRNEPSLGEPDAVWTCAPLGDDRFGSNRTYSIFHYRSTEEVQKVTDGLKPPMFEKRVTASIDGIEFDNYYLPRAHCPQIITTFRQPSRDSFLLQMKNHSTRGCGTMEDLANWWSQAPLNV